MAEKSTNADRTGVRVGPANDVLMQYEVERCETTDGYITDRFNVVHIDVLPVGGIKEIISYERERRGIGRLDQLIHGRVRVEDSVIRRAEEQYGR